MPDLHLAITVMAVNQIANEGFHMADEIPNLGLPFIMAVQIQKYVTQNEAIRALVVIGQLSVLD